MNKSSGDSARGALHAALSLSHGSPKSDGAFPHPSALLHNQQPLAFVQAAKKQPESQS